MIRPGQQVTPPAELTDPSDSSAIAHGPRLVPGTIVVALLMTTGRWGSYLGWPDRQVYLTDILLVSSALWLLMRHGSTLRAALVHGPLRRVLWPVMALIGWALARTLVNPGQPDTLRDLAPYVYLGIALIAAVPVRAQARRRTLFVLCAGLLLHAGWVTVSLLAPAAVSRLPLLGDTVRVLEVRGDFDGAQLAVLAGLATYALGAVRQRVARALLVVIIGWASAVVLLLTNRAALLALLLALTIALLVRGGSLLAAVRQHRAAAAVTAMLVLAALVILVPLTPTYQRIAGAKTFDSNSTAGTTSAREHAWTSVMMYVGSSPSRVLAGVGMGPDFLKDSGAAVNYQAPGEKLVRQPHNYLINTYARLGVIGLGLLGWLLMAIGAAALRVSRTAGRRGADSSAGLDIVSVLLLATLLITAIIGVILESPFGALPFGWAAGTVLARALLPRRARGRAA